MRTTSLRTCISSLRASDCTQAGVTLEAFILYSLSENSQPSSTWSLMAWSPWDGKSIFLAFFIWLRPWRTQRHLWVCLRTWLFILLVYPWKWLEIISKCLSEYPLQFLHSTNECHAALRDANCHLHVCVCPSLPRIGACGLVCWGSQG